MNERCKRAYEYAREKHNGQTRIGGAPYITHPAAVCEIVREWGFGEEYMLCALFHDLLEDTDALESEIEALSSERVLKAVKLLTKTDGYKMSEYIAGIKSDNIAYVVKAADGLHNLRCALCTDSEFKRKYIEETKAWYLDFAKQIPQALSELEKSLVSSI